MFDRTPFEGLGRADADLAQLSASEIATEVHRLDQLVRWAENRRMAAGVALAVLYERPEERLEPAAERATRAGGGGTPVIAEFAVTELAGLLSMSEEGADVWLRGALDTRYRHPRMWEAVMDGRMRAHHAIDVALEVDFAELNCEQAHWVDARFSDRMRQRGWTRSLRLAKGLIVACDPELAERRRQESLQDRCVDFSPSTDGHLRHMQATLDAADGIRLKATIERLADILEAAGSPDPKRQREINKARALGILASPARALALLQGAAPEDTMDLPFLGRAPVVIADPEVVSARRSAVLNVHVSDATLNAGRGVARIESLGPVTLEALASLLSGCRVIVRPMIDLNEVPSVDRYEIPDAVRQLLLVRHVHQNAPFSNRLAPGCDLDHVEPWSDDGPPGQTGPDNLVPVSRRWHRWKTVGGLTVRVVRPGVQHWRTPLGFEYLTTPDGTTYLGQTNELRDHPEWVADALAAA